MTKTEYRRALKALGLSISKAGPFLGVTKRQSFRIAAGAADVPEAARKLLLVMLEHGLTPWSVETTVKNQKLVLRATATSGAPAIAQ